MIGLGNIDVLMLKHREAFAHSCFLGDDASRVYTEFDTLALFPKTLSRISGT